MEYYLHQSASDREEALPLTVTFNGIILRFKIRIIWHRIVNINPGKKCSYLGWSPLTILSTDLGSLSH